MLCILSDHKDGYEIADNYIFYDPSEIKFTHHHMIRYEKTFQTRMMFCSNCGTIQKRSEYITIRFLDGILDEYDPWFNEQTVWREDPFSQKLRQHNQFIISNLNVPTLLLGGQGTSFSNRLNNR